jgi:hypothetical protein
MSEVRVETKDDKKRRLPGEPGDGRSPQLQSWVNAGQDVRNFLGGVGNFFGGLRDNFNRNMPSEWPPPGSDDPRTGSPQSVENIIRGTGTRAFQDPYFFPGLRVGPLINRGIPFGGGGAPSGAGTMPPDLLAIASQNMANNPLQGPQTQTFQDWLTSNMSPFDPSPYEFDSTAYDNYINFLMERDAETEARIRAMYAELGESADANVQRIADIYNTGTANLGDIYSSAAQGTQDAYASAQQQAADQMARLGIEAAAPTVLDPMAMSQAGALSGIEAQRASGLGATQQYGTTAQDFSSQMQQVAQQEGLEVTSSIMARAAQRQAEAAFMREQARAQAEREMRQAQAAYNPYANLFQQMELEQAWNQMQNPQMDWRQQQAMADFEYRMEQDDLDSWRKAYERNLNISPRNPDKALQETIREAVRGTLGTRVRQQVLSNPDFAQYLD